MPPQLSDPRIIAYEDKGLYDVITNGIRTMQSYAKQIDPEDRWAIVAYIRALQLSQKEYVGLGVDAATASQDATKKVTK